MKRLNRLTTVILVICCVVSQILTAGSVIVRAQNTTAYSSYGSTLSTDFNDSSVITSMGTDQCLGTWLNGQLGLIDPYPGVWTTNDLYGWDCPSNSSNATIDLFPSSSNGLPNGVFYDYINVFYDQPVAQTFSGNISILQSDYQITPTYRTIYSKSLDNTYVNLTYYEQYRTQIPINGFLANDWGLRFSVDGTCPTGFNTPNSIGTSTATPSGSSIQSTYYTSCPAISEIQVVYETNTPTPTITDTTATLPPSWTPAPTFTSTYTWSLTIPMTDSCALLALGYNASALPGNVGYDTSGLYGDATRQAGYNDSLAGFFVPHGGDTTTVVTDASMNYGWSASPNSGGGVYIAGELSNFVFNVYAHDTSHINQTGSWTVSASGLGFSIPALLGSGLGFTIDAGSTTPLYGTTPDNQLVYLHYITISGIGTPLDANYCAGTGTPAPTATLTPSSTITPGGPSLTPTATFTPSSTVTPGGPSVTPYPTYTPYPTNTPGSATAYPTYTAYPTNTPGGPTTTPGGPRTIGPLITPTDYPCNADNYVFQNGNNNLGTPCGNLIQWATLALPPVFLPSPTLYIIANTPTAIPVTATPAPTNTPTLTVTMFITVDTGATGTAIAMVATATPILDVSGLSAMSTAVKDDLATLFPAGNLSVSMNGTPVGAAQIAQQSGSQIGAVILLARSLAATGFDAGGMISTSVLLLFFIVAIQLIVTVFPLVLYILKLILQVIQTILTPF